MTSPVQGQTQLNEKVAKLCGTYSRKALMETPLGGGGNARFMSWGEYDGPDYCNDLNACAEMRKALKTQEQRIRFWNELWRDCMVGDVLEHGFRIIDASAEKQVRAFIATMEGKEQHGA